MLEQSHFFRWPIDLSNKDSNSMNKKKKRSFIIFSKSIWLTVIFKKLIWLTPINLEGQVVLQPTLLFSPYVCVGLYTVFGLTEETLLVVNRRFA